MTFDVLLCQIHAVFSLKVRSTSDFSMNLFELSNKILGYLDG